MDICSRLENQIFTHDKLGSGKMTHCHFNFATIYALVEFEKKTIRVDILFCIRFGFAHLEDDQLQIELEYLVEEKKRSPYNTFHCPKYIWDSELDLPKVYQSEKESVFMDVEQVFWMFSEMLRRKGERDYYG